MSEVPRRRFVQALATLGFFPRSKEAMADGPADSLPGTTLKPPVESQPELSRGPYLQAPGSDRIVVRWRTDESARNVKLLVGEDPNRLDRVIESKRTKSPVEHVCDWAAVVENLEPSHTYYYAIEASTAILAGFDESHRFTTSPLRGKAHKSRFLALGDCGTNRVDSGNPGKALAARNGFRAFTKGTEPVDAILLLGDNAYSHGTDAQSQTALFSVYHDEFLHTPVWPCVGNHELTDDYFDVFTVPEAGEIGGVPSRSSHYYSFDHANIHFCVLDLWKTEWRTSNSPQRRWLEADLATTNQDWTIVINHFPPYCDGKYESDTNGFLVEVREKILPALERHGVDMLLTGHDHKYQRSYLLDGHHGTRSTFDPNKHLKALSDGTQKEPFSKLHGPHSGIVVVVSGTAGAPQPADLSDPHATTLSHPAMVKLSRGDQAGRGSRRLGSFLLEVDRYTLVGSQVDDEGQVIDRFFVNKTHT